MNSKECFELAHWAIVKAKKQGANAASVDVSDRRQVEVQYRDKKLEKLQESKQHSLSISIYSNRRYSAHSTNDLRKDSLSKFVEEAVAMTKYLAEDPYRTLPDPKYYVGQAKVDLKILDPGYDQVETTDRIRMAKELEAAAMAVSDRIISVTANYNDNVGRLVKVHSNGFEGEQEDSSFVIFATVTVKDEQGTRPEDYAFAVTRYRKELPEVAAVGQEAARRALGKIGQHKINSGKFDLVVENRVGSQLLGSLIGPMSGGALQQKSSFLEGMSGQKIASDLFTMIDDPLILGGLGSCRFDGEGMTAKRRIMIEKGVLKSFYIDNYYGRKLKMDPSTGGPTNLVFEYGSQSRDEIIKGIKQGILGNGFIGGNSNSTTGDFSFGVMGQYIENGGLVKPVNEMNISGNMKDFLKQLATVGNDPFPYGAWKVSTLHFREVQFSGV